MDLVLLMKGSIFWGITKCSPLKVNRRFGGNCRLHLHSWKISQVRKQHEADSKLFLLPISCWFLALVTVQPRIWRRHLPTKRWLTFNGQHGVISLKIELFIITAVRTSILFGTVKYPNNVTVPTEFRHGLWVSHFRRIQKSVLRTVVWTCAKWSKVKHSQRSLNYLLQEELPCSHAFSNRRGWILKASF
jgi:hypothetical protein